MVKKVHSQKVLSTSEQNTESTKTNSVYSELTDTCQLIYDNSLQTYTALLIGLLILVSTFIGWQATITSPETHVAEVLAQAQQTLDLDTDAHFDIANVMGTQILEMAALLCWLTLSLFLLTVAEALHPARWMIRYGAAVLGIASMGIGVWGVWNAA